MATARAANVFPLAEVSCTTQTCAAVVSGCHSVAVVGQIAEAEAGRPSL
jgi:hypothetical protein